MTERTGKRMEFRRHGRREVLASFDGGMSSDGGALLLREVDWRLRLMQWLAGCFRDERNARLVRHPLTFVKPPRTRRFKIDTN
jgi:hypothetical protein